jgi:biopolymer transport protein ExbB
VFDLIIRQLATFGGPVLIALFLVSIAATATTIFKALQFSRLGVGQHRVARQALTFWHNGDRAQAFHLASSDTAQLSAVITSAMSALGHNPRDINGARQLATQTALQALSGISRYLRVIEAVVQAAPMLGLLGTVIGMIEAFGKVSQGGGAADPAALANGIWIALTTTALGLTVAIPFYFVSVWLESRVDAERAAMDAAIAEVTIGTT